MKGTTDIARRFSHQKMADMIKEETKSKGVAISTEDARTLPITPSVRDLQEKLYQRHASAVVARMLDDGEVTLGPSSPNPPKASTNPTAALATNDVAKTPNETSELRTQVVAYLDENLDFDLRQKSSVQGSVLQSLKQLQSTAALAHTPEALPGLSNAGMTSAVIVSQMPEKSFVSRMGEKVGGEGVARAIHAHAANITTRNAFALTSLLQSARGSGLAMIDRNKTKAEIIAESKDAAEQEPEQINLTTLFGTMDVCECDDCNSVTSPAAYFVELLQYLRNNNLDPNSPFMDSTDPDHPHGVPEIGDKTPLGVLLARRPDIACLELTCANTQTVLPYIDLGSEVMESFIVHLDQYAASAGELKKANIDVYNANPDETEGLGGSTAELLAQPQNTRDEAYCILANAVYPSTQLPFNQPVEAIRLFLEFLQTSRADLGERFREKYEPPKLTIIHDLALDRANDAERLLLSEEEYIILTKEAFWPKEHFDIRHGHEIPVATYQEKIGVRKDWEYWGVDYTKLDDMLSQDPVLGTGLTFVKNQFLPRTGITYADLVELLRTDFINENMLKGRDAVIMETFRMSYAFMKHLVLPGNGKERFWPLVYALGSPQWYLYLKIAKAPDVMHLFDEDEDGCGTKNVKKCHRCHPHKCICKRRRRILKWLCQNFERMGKLTVLDSPNMKVVQEQLGPRLALQLAATSSGSTSTAPLGLAEDEIVIGRLLKDGSIVEWDGKSDFDPEVNLKVIGRVNPLLEKVDYIAPDGTKAAWSSKYPEKPPDNSPKETRVLSLDGAELGKIDPDSKMTITAEVGHAIPWMGLTDDCDISRDRLQHLDGSSLLPEEYDRIHRFIRLWRKLGWTMVELDAALRVLGIPKTEVSICPPSVPENPPPGENTGDEAVVDTCRNAQKPDGQPQIKCGCHPHQCKCGKEMSSTPGVHPVISTAFLHELVSLKKLADLTGLDTLNICAFWGAITTAGNPSLYSKLFLTHNLLGIDRVFAADENKNYLAQSPPEKIKDHVPILLAAFQLKVTIFNDMMASEVETDLTLKNVSQLYRVVLMARVLGVAPTMIPLILKTLQINDAFESASKTLALVELWNKMSDAGFNLAQLTYLFSDTEANPLRPIGPTQRVLLQTTMSIYTKLGDIEVQHPDINAGAAGDADAAAKALAKATSAVVLEKLQLLFDSKLSTKTLEFLEGSHVFQTNTSPGLVIVVPKDSSLASKLRYTDGEKGRLEITGQLTDDERAKAETLSGDPDWVLAVKKCSRQAATFLKTFFQSGVFPEAEQQRVKDILLAGDVPVSTNSNTPSNGTAPGKRVYFLTWFIPYLRRKLADNLVIDTMAAATSIDPLVCRALLTNIITDPDDKTEDVSKRKKALEALEAIKLDPAGPSGGFEGYLVPSATDTYTIIGVANAKPQDLRLDDIQIEFKYHSDEDEPSDWYATDPIQLAGGRLYQLSLQGIKPNDVLWKTERSQATQIPSSALLSDHVTGSIKKIFTVFYKASLEINGFSLSADEVVYFSQHRADFDSLDWNAISLTAWKRLADYCKLRDSLPKSDVRLIDIFAWAGNSSSDIAMLSDQINKATLWEKADIDQLVSEKHYNLTKLTDFLNEKYLIKIQRALEVSTKVGMSIDLLFQWAKPQINFWKLRDIRDGIRTAIRAKYKLSEWEVAIKPTYDKLRQLMSNALTAYLVNQPSIRQQGHTDADGLFEFLLIDTQMCPCMETSRMKQATSSVQLFIQRCFLDLESRYGIRPEMLDRDRWEWMQKYRVWEANRKVFLYPENWIQPSLRDDKSPIYLQLESELMQRDLTAGSILEIMKNFLFHVDEVANLEVNAIHFEDYFSHTDGANGNDVAKRMPRNIHFFARTRGAPYKFYYRVYAIESQTWAPWQDVAVDIPRYEVEREKKDPNAANTIAEAPTPAESGGFYIIPFTFNSRLLLAVPQFAKIQIPAPVPPRKLADIGNNDNADQAAPDECWEIKMGLSEFRNGKWSPKFITSEKITDRYPTLPKPLPALGAYRFVVRERRLEDEQQQGGGLPPAVSIYCYRLKEVLDPKFTTMVTPTPIGVFSYTGSQFGLINHMPTPSLDMTWSDFHFQLGPPEGRSDDGPKVMLPIQSNNEGTTFDHQDNVVIKYPPDNVDRSSKIVYDAYPDRSGDAKQQKTEDFYHPFVDSLLQRVSSTDNLDDLFLFFAPTQTSTETAWQQIQHLKDGFEADAYGALYSDPTRLFHEQRRPYALYNWELGFHAPMAIVDRLVQHKQFDLALRMMHYVFDPQSDKEGDVQTRVWQWLPFRRYPNHKESIRDILSSLRPNTADSDIGQITEWRNKPFQPHVIARLRPLAYMKYVVMKYINILIAYGDYYFMQNTLETIPMAIQLYVLASHVYGPPGQKIPKRGKKKVQTYKSLMMQWDAFSNAMVQMEILFPFSINQITTPTGKANGVEGLANIFGFASTGYFCVPDNPELRALRTTIDDRLFKIRHCQDINGIERKLPLYELPIDPGLLVAATAAGMSLSSALNDLNAPLPNFRFKYLLRVSLDMCEHLRRLGKAFVIAKERKDAEAMLELKQRHENIISQKIMEQKKLARDEAQKAVDTLQQSRKVPEYRMKHNLQLLGEDLGQIPNTGDVESEFKELADKIEAPVVESGLKLITSEKEELEKFGESLDMKPIMNALETVASEFHLLPILNAHASPFGVGVASCWGFPNIAKGVQGVAKAYNMVSEWLAAQSTNVNRVQGFLKQNQARSKDANTAGHEIKHIDQQIVTQKIRVATHEADIAAQETSIANSQAVYEFLTTKYTGAELYSWSELQLSGLYYQTYTLTYDIAKKAEMAYRFERGISDTSDPPPYIRFGYWEPRNDGLLSGERLYCSLKELEIAYQETRGHDFEITKHASLRSINPIALFKLRSDASTDFSIPETLFDMDFPGHYARRIKTVALTIRLRPNANGVEQPYYYSNVNCTLRLTSNKFRTSPFVRGPSDYPEKEDQDDDRFSQVNYIPISAIAASSPSHDSGLFELKFDDERFFP
ncbi:hypothetical protein BKA61DRAFT_531231, partial [Leptodontidium sp. MPI-SDFR-AT-0119]